MNRGDGLSCFQNISGPESGKIKKKLWKIHKKHGLNITVECNLHITDFLGVTFDLRTGKFYPYRKVNNELLCIYKHSNYPPSITKPIPAMISKRISNIPIFYVIKSALIKISLTTIIHLKLVVSMKILNSQHE